MQRTEIAEPEMMAGLAGIAVDELCEGMQDVSRALARGDMAEALQLLTDHAERYDLPPGWAGQTLLELVRALPEDERPGFVPSSGPDQLKEPWYTRPLNGREIEVLFCAMKGMSSDETGRTLCISRWTVQTYRKRLLAKLGARNMAHAVALFLDAQEQPA